MRPFRLPAARPQHLVITGAVALLIAVVVTVVAVRATSSSDPEHEPGSAEAATTTTSTGAPTTSSSSTTATAAATTTATTALLPPLTATSAPAAPRSTAPPRTTGATPPPTAPVTTTPPPPPTSPAAPASKGRVYPWHTRIVATTFWVGELFDESIDDGSQVCSTYDSDWAFHWSGIDAGRVPDDAAGCGGSILGGCDGVRVGDECRTEVRTAGNGYFPSQASPRENPFYLDLPFDDLNDDTGFSSRCSVIPWAGDPGYSGRCGDHSFSLMKNRWVRLIGPNGNTCYGQIQDAGPSHDDLYHDAAYVFGSDDRRPAQKQFNNAGLDVSPALNGCLGFEDLDGQDDRVDWQFVDDVDVPDGPWTRVVTTSGVHN